MRRWRIGGATRWGFALMGIAAAATALTAYLLGTVINKTYVNKDFPGSS